MSIHPTTSPVLHVLRLVCLLLVSLGVLPPAWGDPLPMTIGLDARIDLTPVIGLLRDSTNSLSVDDAEAQAGQFKAVSREGLRRGFDASSFWLRASLYNPSGAPIERWLSIGHPRIQSVTLFQRTEDGWQALDSGTKVPRDLKPIPTTVPTFPLLIEAGATRDILIRVKSETALDMEATLWSPLAFLLEKENRHLLVMLAIGFSLLTAITSLIAYYFIREPQYIYFGLLHFSASILDFSREGLFQQTLWPADLPFLPQLVIVASACALVCLVFLQRNILALKQQYSYWDKAFLVIAMVTILSIPISFVNYSLAARSISIIVSSFFLLTIVTIIPAAWKGRSARFLALAYGVLWVNETARQLTNLQVLSVGFSFQLSISWSLLLASPLMVMALAARTRQLSSQLMLTQQTNQARTEFFARVSHELRTPLNTIIGYARMLGRNSPRLSFKDGIRDIEKNGQRLLGMIDELLDQSRIETGRLRLAPHPLAFNAWLQELERAALRQSETAGNAFRMVRPESCSKRIFVDSQRLRQVIDNLITNANQHTHGGSIELKVEAIPSSAENHLRLVFWVKDNGSGIHVEDQAHVFEPFFQGKPAESHNSHLFGMGLGLSIASDLVGLMGGELSVRSKPGAGSSFKFWIECPYADPLALEDGKENSHDDPSMAFSGLDPLSAGDRMNIASAQKNEMDPADRPQTELMCPPRCVQRVEGTAEMNQGERFPRSTELPLTPLSVERIQRLELLIKAGEITEIEKWCDMLARDAPEYCPFAGEVRKAALEIDFHKLSELAKIPLDRNP